MSGFIYRPRFIRLPGAATRASRLAIAAGSGVELSTSTTGDETTLTIAATGGSDAGITSLSSADAAEGLPHVTAANTWASLTPPSSSRSEYVLGWDGAGALTWVARAHGLIFAVGLYEAVAYGPTHYAGITGSLV